MFFCLARFQDFRFPNHFRLGGLWLSTDQGWQVQDTDQFTVVWKGYSDSIPIPEITENNTVTGNFCSFRLCKTSRVVHVVYNLSRAFPLWYQHSEHFGNLRQGDHSVWADSDCWLDQDLVLTEHKQDIMGQVSTDGFLARQLVQRVHDMLNRKVKHFLDHNTRPIKVYLSGGLDTALVYSYIKRHTDDYELVLGEHIDYDHFWCKNQGRIRQQFWSYRQIHHWQDPCVLVSGAAGDEFMLRNPNTANLWLMYHGSSIPSIAKYFSRNEYFLLEKNLKVYQKHQEEINEVSQLSREQFFRYLINIVVNDFQHWHIGNTLTFTPLRDLEIFKMFLRLISYEAVEQIMLGSITKELITMNDPGVLDLVSKTKDSGEELENIVNLLQSQ